MKDRHVRGDGQGQDSPLPPASAERTLAVVLQGAAQVEVDVLQGQAAGLDLGEVQDVVEHGQEGVAESLTASR